MKKIVILGDFNPAYHTHLAVNETIRHLADAFNDDIAFEWVDTDKLDIKKDLNTRYSGIWVASGSPYKDMQNVINAIQYARENNIPTFGNCGGFQHMIIEYARNVCGITDADSEETKPGGKNLVISQMSCSLVGQQEEISVAENSKLYSLVQKKHLIGKYHCSYALNPEYIPVLKTQVPFRGFRGRIKMTATNPEGTIRAFELPSHRFFIGTLFQPALTSTADEPNPILMGFVKSVMT